MSEPIHAPDNPIADGGVRLFKHSPAGIIFDHRGECISFCLCVLSFQCLLNGMMVLSIGC